MVGLAMLQRAERREPKNLVEPHIDAAQCHANRGAKARPERLDVADALEVLAYFAVAPRRFIGLQFIMFAPRSNRLRHMIGGKHAGQDGVVRPLDARHVDEACGAADKRATGE